MLLRTCWMMVLLTLSPSWFPISLKGVWHCFHVIHTICCLFASSKLQRMPKMQLIFSWTCLFKLVYNTTFCADVNAKSCCCLKDYFTSTNSSNKLIFDMRWKLVIRTSWEVVVVENYNEEKLASQNWWTCVLHNDDYFFQPQVIIRIVI